MGGGGGGGEGGRGGRASAGARMLMRVSKPWSARREVIISYRVNGN